MKERPTVSVIVATHNYGRYLGDALESVRSQTFPLWECIVVDDGSTDETQAVLAAACARDGRFHAFRQDRRGVAAARNRALRASAGRYVQFLDADDRLDRTALEARRELLDRDHGVDIAYGFTTTVQAGVPPVESVRSSTPEVGPHSDDVRPILTRLVESNIMTIEAALVRRSVFESVGVFNESLQRLEDWDLWIRAAAAGKTFRFVPTAQPIAIVTRHSGSLSAVDPHVMFDALSSLRRGVDPDLEGPLKARNRLLLRQAQVEAGIAFAVVGEAKHGLRLLLGAVGDGTRVRALVWAAVATVTFLPGGRRLLRLLRRLRSDAIVREV